MKIYGREITFRNTVEAQFALAAICPEGKLERIGELEPKGNRAARMAFYRKMAVIVSEATERALAFEAKMRGEEYAPRPLTDEELGYLPPHEFDAVINEMFASLTTDSATTVQTEAPKKKKADK